LPLDVFIEHLGVGQLDWRVGASVGTIRGLAFGYAGGAKEHRWFDLALVATQGALTGNVTIGAEPPFRIAGHLAAQGDAAFAGADSGVELGGSLAGITLAGSGKMGTARFTGRARVAPLALFPLQEALLEASDVDPAIDPALPNTRVAAIVRVSRADGTLAGTIEATNAAPGSIDQGKVPVLRLATHYTLRDEVLALDGLEAGLAGSGTLTGQARLPLASRGAVGTWSLDVREIDLKALHTTLVPTRLAGTITADLQSSRQRISGPFGCTIVGRVALDFDAVVADEVIAIDRYRLAAASCRRPRRLFRGAFDFEALATRFDPARFGEFPAGALDGRIVANGVLAPAWQVRADVALKPGSRLAGTAVGGTARGTVAANGIRDAKVDLAIGRAKGPR
jgi:translocation and assembly module TamB